MNKTAIAVFVSLVAGCSSTGGSSSSTAITRSMRDAQPQEQTMLARVVPAALPPKPVAPPASPPPPKVELAWHPQELAGGLQLAVPWQIHGVDPGSMDVLIAGGDSYEGDHDGASILVSSLRVGAIGGDDEILGAFADNALSKHRKRIGARSVEVTETQRTVLGHHAMELDLRATGYDGTPTRVRELVFASSRQLFAIAMITPAAASYADDAWKQLVDSMKVDDSDHGFGLDRHAHRDETSTDVFGSYRY